MKRRVLILGGGCGGVACAWALSRTPELRARYEVSIVQSGWRLGGKGATGRDPERHHAVLEHGLHLWLGFYDAAFGMLADVYGAWRHPGVGPQRSIEAAFTPMRHVTLFGGTEEAPARWSMRFPELPGRPWDPPTSRARSYPRRAAIWLRSMQDALRSEHGGPLRADHARVLTGLARTLARGLATEWLRHGTGMWQAMDELDLRDWLRSYGATEQEACAPPIGALYDLGFAYPSLEPGPGKGAAAAGVAARVLLNIFGGYRGAPFFRMNAGMGDTVFAPMYEVLRDRGVKIRFFERVEHLTLCGQEVTEVQAGLQATGAEAYDPLMSVQGLKVWPDRPLADRVLALASGDLEHDGGASLATKRYLLGRDFDDVVIAIPSTAHHHFARELVQASPEYAAMVEHTHGVPTIAGQWWMARRPAQLGWQGPTGVVTGMPGLFRTWADLSEVVDAEAWPERPASLAYFCSVAFPELREVKDRAQAGRMVTERMRRWAGQELPEIWPGAVSSTGAFDEACLWQPPGAAPWSTPYARANVADWERYILSLPGTTKYRLGPGDAPFSNVYLAGDWTKNRVNGGSVEGAVTSGIEAARCIDVGR